MNGITRLSGTACPLGRANIDTDAIIAAAVQSLIGYGEKYAREFIAKRIESAVSDAIADRLPSLIDDAFDATIEVGDDWSGTRQSKTLRALVVERARKDLDLRDMRSSFDRSPAAKFIHEEIECIVRDDLKNEFNAARDAVRKKVTTKAAELLAAETMREAGIR